MISNMNDELSLDKIDDYNNKESKTKKKTVRNVILLCLTVGIIITYFKVSSYFDDYIGTQEAPGIIIIKK